MNGAKPVDTVAWTLEAAMRIANRAVVADIETNALRVQLGDQQRWWDVRPMLDEREHAPQSIDMAREAIDYAVVCGLATRHPQQPHLLRFDPYL